MTKKINKSISTLLLLGLFAFIFIPDSTSSNATFDLALNQ